MKCRNSIFSKVWQKKEESCLEYPNGQIAKEVLVNVMTGEKIIRRYNECGNLIFSNQSKYGY